MGKILVLILTIGVVYFIFRIYINSKNKNDNDTNNTDKKSFNASNKGIVFRDVEDETQISTHKKSWELDVNQEQDGLGSQERKNPDTVDMAYLNLEDSENLKRNLEQEHIGQQEITKTEKEVREQEELIREQEAQDKKEAPEKRETKIEDKTEAKLKFLLEQQKRREEYLRRKSEDCVEMNLTRENSTDETLKMWIYRTMKVNPQKVERVRTGLHSYEYRIYDQTGKDVGKDVLTPKLGGTDPRRRIWVLNNQGNYVSKEVDSLLLTQNGRYGFATDRGNGPLSDVPTTYQVTRLPGGEYVAVQALEQQKRNREASQVKAVKEMTASKNSDHEMKDKIAAVKTAKDINAVQEDRKIDTSEVEIVEMLKKEGLQRQEIDKVFEDVYQGAVKEGMTCGQVEKTGVMIKDLKEQGCSMEKIKEILKQNEGELTKAAEENDDLRGRVR